MGDFASRCGFQVEMSGMRPSGDGATETGRKKYPGNSKKGLKHPDMCDKISTRDVLPGNGYHSNSLFPNHIGSQRP